MFVVVDDTKILLHQGIRNFLIPFNNYHVFIPSVPVAYGHLARVCSQRKFTTNQLDERLENYTTEYVPDYIADINWIKSEITDKYMITITIEGKKICMEFDTGAALSTMSLNDYENLQINNKIFDTNIKLKTYTGEIFKAIGVT